MPIRSGVASREVSIFTTIWDGGGTDTYDFSNYTTNLNVNLQPGGWTTLDPDGHQQLADLAANPANGHVWAAGNIANALVFDFNDGAPGSGAGVIENATGGSGNDTIIGNYANNVLIGNDGADALIGGAGADTLTGGPGNDYFVFNSLIGYDTIADFVSGSDKVEFDHTVFTAIGSSLTSDEVRFGATAADPNDYIIYDSSDGLLSYDADGSGGGTAVQVALLGTHPVLSFGDFSIV